MPIGRAVFDVALGLDARIRLLLLHGAYSAAVFGTSMTRPISRSFQAMPSGIGVCCAEAVPAHIAAITAKAGVIGFIAIPISSC